MGTVLNALPATASVTLTNHTTISLPINWALAGTSFNSAPGAVNQFEWALTLGTILPGTVATTGAIDVTNFHVLPVIMKYDAPSWVMNFQYDFQFEATGLPVPTWAYAGALPPGLTLSESGLLTGIPTTVGESTFTVTAETPNGSDSKEITLQIFSTGTAPVITVYEPPDAVDGRPYSFRFEASGTPPPTWSVAEGSNLPPGLTLDADGTLSGVPIFSDEFTFTVVASNGAGQSATREVTLGIHARRAVNSTTPTMSISNEFADRGEEVTVQFRVDNNPGFANMVFSVDFPDDLTLVSYESHPTLLEGRQFPGLEDDQHGIYLGWIAGNENFYSEGPVLTLTFMVNPNAQRGFKPITAVFESYHGYEFPTDENKVELTDFVISSGGVTVREFLLGDIDGDGRITSADATLLARWLIGQYVAIDSEVADLDGKGIRSFTLTLLSRWLVGHDVSHHMVNGP